MGAHDPSLLQTITDLGALFSQKPEKELILTRTLTNGSELARVTEDMNARRAGLIARGIAARTACGCIIEEGETDRGFQRILTAI